VPKRQKDISGIEDKVISMYTKGMSVTQISKIIEDIYDFEISEGTISNITDRLLPKIEKWQNRLLSSIYPIVFIYAIHFFIREDDIIKKLAAYVVLGINDEGHKEILTIEIGKNENIKY
jgi:transposase-like protein